MPLQNTKSNKNHYEDAIRYHFVVIFCRAHCFTGVYVVERKQRVLTDR